MSAEPDLTSIPIRVLVVDDDETHAQTVADSLESQACDCTVASSGKNAIAAIEGEAFDVVITDLMMDEYDGIDILQRTKEELPQTEVILLTGHGSINSAVKAMQIGAYTYLTKPLDISELRAAVEKAAKPIRLIRRNAELNAQLDEKFGFEGVIGHSRAMQKVVDQLKSIAPTEITVMILGDNGTGKELVARAIHQNSHRKGKPFVPLNISAVPESILESELFGHEKGAYTSADSRRIGKFEYANGGTLFLDEVGEMPMETQIKLLRVLEDRKITRLGANEEIDVNVRIVSATNADMDKMVADGKFRQDLYYRLNSMQVDMPPLRERKDDIPLLLEHFRKEFCEQYKKEVQGFSRQARQAMMSFQWEGNIRQLRNVVERLVVLDNDGLLDVDGLPDPIAALVVESVGEDGDIHQSGSDSLIGRPLADVEKYYAQRALDLTNGKREEAAALLGIGERTLYRKIKEWGLGK